MTILNSSTFRRLKKLPQSHSIWEGDRRSLQLGQTPLGTSPAEGECILWVDGLEGCVRSMDLVPSLAGPEVMVRTLIQAMEHPQGTARPARPQKIVVRDRETQFFLRGVLQNLDIAVDYNPSLPLIDEIFRGFQEATHQQHSPLPDPYNHLLNDKAQQLWQDSPWQFLEEQEILAIEINQWEVGTLYASTMGMLGMEYGVLFYRSLDSLKHFRQQVLSADNDEIDTLEEAFLQQDCLYVTFEQEVEPTPKARRGTAQQNAQPNSHPSFGTIHPFEGLRQSLYEEEAIAIWVALEALHQFFKQFQAQLEDDFPALRQSYTLDLPPVELAGASTATVIVSTLPEVAAELADDLADDGDELSLRLDHDLIPHQAFVSIGFIPWDTLAALRTALRDPLKHHQPSDHGFPEKGDGFPVLIVQTTRPKAKTLIQTLQDAGGLKSIFFNPGRDPFVGKEYDLGILLAEDGVSYLFSEYDVDSPVHQSARKKWDRRCSKTQGHCGLVVAMGASGASRGNPKIKDMLALFEVKSLNPEEVGFGLLELQLWP